MTRKEKILAVIALTGGLGLAAQPAWNQSQPGSDKAGTTIPERIDPRPGPETLPGSGAAGMSAEDIKKVEEALRARGHNPGPVDGVMDGQTQQALRDFQRANNLKATGVLDQQTVAKLGIQVGGKTSGMGGESSGKGSSPSGAQGSSGSSGSER